MLFPKKSFIIMRSFLVRLILVIIILPDSHYFLWGWKTHCFFTLVSSCFHWSRSNRAKKVLPALTDHPMMRILAIFWLRIDIEKKTDFAIIQISPMVYLQKCSIPLIRIASLWLKLWISKNICSQYLFSTNFFLIFETYM